MNCSEHPDAKAPFRCESCQRLLCDACIDEGHALQLCSHCGERALPVSGAPPTSLREQRKQQVLDRPYSLKEAFLYPFRGLGAYVFVAALLSFGLANFVLMYSIFFILTLVFYIFFLAFMASFQFKIVRTSADGDDELPDWPDFSDLWERLSDLLAVVAIWLLRYSLVFVLVLAVGLERLLEVAMRPHQIWFWAALAICLWLGSALSVMAKGAAGTYDRIDLIQLHLHYKGFRGAGADAVTTTNLVFGVEALLLILSAVLSQGIPVLGSLIAGVLSVYWFLTGPHLIGVLFRRHRRLMDDLYIERLVD
ncbi:MAG: B-box zinc finger protein [Deltaproteobacteria bacterium]|nr:B-box zinc finger protein [Deltaproteobacteria bacterium]